MNLILRLKKVIETGNLPYGEPMDFFSKWLIIVRANFFSITPTSVLIGGLLALLYTKSINLIDLLIILIGMLFAHSAFNMVNDFYDYKYGLDSGDYTRMKYSPHPLATKMVDERQFIIAIFVFLFIDTLIMWYFYIKVGFGILIIAFLGFLLGFFYTAPPLKLKYFGGLGEPAVFLVWGPLITIGTYFALTGFVSLKVLFVSFPYGLIVLGLLLSDHLNKYEDDKKRNVRTLPVVLGFTKAQKFTKFILILFYILIIIFVFLKFIPVFTLITFFSFKKFMDLLKILSSPKPALSEENKEILPFWYVFWFFRFSKSVSFLLVVGLFIGFLLPNL